MSLTSIKLTDAAAIGVPHCLNRYATVSPFNQDRSKVLILEVANFALYDRLTRQRIGQLLFLGDEHEPLWSKTDPDLFYYHVDCRIRSFRLSTGDFTDLFTGDSELTFKGEGDIQGGRIAVLADGYVFLVDVDTGHSSPAFDTGGRPFDSLYATPDGNCLISWGVRGPERYQGVELYDRDMRFVRQLTTFFGHKDVTRDTDGSEVMVITDNATNAVMKVPMSGAPPTEILPPLDWSLAVNISCADSGDVLVSTYGDRNDVERANALLMVPLTPGPVRQIALHNSVGTIGGTIEHYDRQPKGALNKSGEGILFNSNAGVLNGPVNAYMIDLEPPVGPLPEPQDGLQAWPESMKRARRGWSRVKGWFA